MAYSLGVQFEQRVVIVTGASSGIGKACATEIASRGGSVVMNARSASDLDSAASDVRKAGEERRVVTVPGDAADTATAQRCVDAAIERWQRVDGLINSAGGSTGRVPLEAITEATLNASAHRNVQTAVMMCQAVVPQMRSAGYGRIVNIASLAGRTGSAIGGLEYSANKAAVIGFTKALAAQVGMHGIVANAIAPGLILTPRAENLYESLTSDVQEDILRAIPVGRHGTASEVAAPAVFLCSAAASFINGAVLDVNGGRYM